MLNNNFAGTMSNIVYYCRSKQMSARVDQGDDDDDDAGEGREAFVLGASIRSQDATLLPAGEETISGRGHIRGRGSYRPQRVVVY